MPTNANDESSSAALADPTRRASILDAAHTWHVTAGL